MERKRQRRTISYLSVLGAAAAALLALLVGPDSPWLARAATNRFVATTGSDASNDCSNSGAPCATIAHAITQAMAGDTIQVAAGTYMENVTVDRNVTIQGAGAGSTTVDGNDAGSVFVIQSGVTATLEQLTITNGQSGLGGGVRNSGTVTITNSTLSGNSADSGGGIFNVSGSTMTITNSTLSGNSALGGGGIANEGTMTITNSTLSGNSSGFSSSGLVNSGTVTITNSTLSGNSPLDGGGIGNSGTMTITNSTLSGDSASGGGAGILNNGTVNIRNSIVANSPSGGNCGGAAVTPGGVNFSTDGTCAGFTQVTSVQLNLGPLQNNGGDTETHALLSGSVAINAGDQSICTSEGITTDQRGQMRISNCDAGAFEFRTCMTNGDCGTGNCCAASECLVDGSGGGCTPTAVEIVSFTARDSGQGVDLEWQTASEADIAGFNLLRSADEGQTYAMLNDVLIPAQASGSPVGFRYEFRDAALPRSGRYWYVLEVMALDGPRRRLGPVKVVVKRSVTVGERPYGGGGIMTTTHEGGNRNG